MKKILVFGVIALFLVSFASAASITGGTIDDENSTESNKICCHIYGLGNMMKKVNSKYQWMEESECVVPENFVGGGREIIDDNYCQNKAQIQAKTLTKTQIQKITNAENRLRIQSQGVECPENCTCTGSVTKCQLESGREMTVRAGNSGNMIVQVKGVNASTKVTLYKSEGKVYGVFKNNETKIINVLPDEVKERIKERIRARLESHNITLDEDGIYQVQVKKQARLFGLFHVRERVRIHVDSETGNIIKTKTSWWGFLARDVEETAEEE